VSFVQDGRVIVDDTEVSKPAPAAPRGVPDAPVLDDASRRLVIKDTTKAGLKAFYHRMKLAAGTNADAKLVTVAGGLRQTVVDAINSLLRLDIAAVNTAFDITAHEVTIAYGHAFGGLARRSRRS
jgi:hypothetical protein